MADYPESQLDRRVIGCAIRVHRELGPGFIESIYRNALIVDLRRDGIAFEVEKEIVVYYDGAEVGRHRLDLFVENILILELKAIEQLATIHYMQLRSYLKATNLPYGLLMNFGTTKLDVRRVERDR